MSSVTQMLCSGAYGLIDTECGPRPSSKSLSHCVHDSITLPVASTTTMQLRNSGVAAVACWPREPQKPLKLFGSFSGSFSSPRFAMKIRFGVSAKMPPVEPQMYPGLATDNGSGHFSATLYGPVISSPPFSCTKAGAGRSSNPITTANVESVIRIEPSPDDSYCLSRTCTLSIGWPCGLTPFWVRVSILPSLETASVTVPICFPLMLVVGWVVLV